MARNRSGAAGPAPLAFATAGMAFSALGPLARVCRPFRLGGASEEEEQLGQPLGSRCTLLRGLSSSFALASTSLAFSKALLALPSSFTLLQGCLAAGVLPAGLARPGPLPVVARPGSLLLAVPLARESGPGPVGVGVPGIPPSLHIRLQLVRRQISPPLLPGTRSRATASGAVLAVSCQAQHDEEDGPWLPFAGLPISKRPKVN